jgi:hypothetical protein
MFYGRAPSSVGSVQKKAKSKKKKKKKGSEKDDTGIRTVTLLSLVQMQQVHN